MTRRFAIGTLASPLLALPREELLHLPNYTAFDWLTVDVENGKTILSGCTANPALKLAAEAALELTSSEVELLSHSKSDEELRLAVWKKLQSDAGLKALKASTGFHRNAYLGGFPIHVLVDKGVVTLRGLVASPAQSLLANRLANSVPGLEHVRNFLLAAS